MSNREGGRLVWLRYERCHGELVGRMGAFFSYVKFTKGGIEYEVLVENDEIMTLEDLIEYDDDDE